MPVRLDDSTVGFFLPLLMHLALVSQEYPPETAKGGLGTQTLAKARGMRRRGHEVTVISRTSERGWTDRDDDGVRVIRVPGAESRFAIHTEVADWVTYSAAVAETLERVHRERPVDLVDFPEWGAEGYVFFINRTEWNRIPAVVHLHGPLVMFAHTMGWPAIDSEFYRTGTMLEGTCVRLADAIMSSSRCSLDWCVRHYGIDASDAPVIHTGIDTDHFRPDVAVKAARPTVVFAGKMVRNKGVFTLVDAALQLTGEFPGLQVRLLGRGEAKVINELQRRVQQAGCSALLEMPGFVSQEDLPAHFAAAQVFAAPSIYEGGPGFVYLEAMACGLPVVACAGSGAAEVINDRQTGRLVPPDDVGALSTVLRELLGDHARREAMGADARRYAVTEASTSRCLDRLETFYQTTLARCRAGAP